MIMQGKPLCTYIEAARFGTCLGGSDLANHDASLEVDVIDVCERRGEENSSHLVVQAGLKMNSLAEQLTPVKDEPENGSPGQEPTRTSPQVGPV